jgi:exodeoxyribonuclease V gamma subunit
MFYLHTSNKTENLLAHLDTVLKNSKTNAILEKQTFLIQSEGMGRWLMQQMAIKNKLFCNYEFIFPNRFFERIAKSVGCHLLDEDFDRANLVWRIYSILSSLDISEFHTLRSYIDGDVTGVKRFQLSQQLANLFDQYQIVRPEILFNWQNNECLFEGTQYEETELWQQTIWLEIIKQIRGDAKSRTELWQEAIYQVKHHQNANDFPKVVSIFGINNLPEVYLKFLEALSAHIDIHLYLLNPSQEYWLDIPSKKQIALENLHKGFDQQADLLEAGHPLLANFGKQGQYFQELLLLEEKHFESHFESFLKTEGRSWLEHVQNDLLCNQLRLPNHTAMDDSIKIHNCHTPIRELEVLKNEILYVLDETDIQLRDIVIMAPNIEDYAPYVPAIFSDIKHTLADETLRNANPLIDAFEQFFQVIMGRFGWQEVLDLLTLPELQSSFDINENELEQIAYWVKETNVRWAYAKAHKQELGIPADELNTWFFGLQRMMMGYAIGDDQNLFEGISTYIEIEGQSSIVLGKLYQYINFLITARRKFSKQYTLADWVNHLSDQVSVLFKDENVQSYHKVELLTKLTDLTKDALAFFEAKLEFKVILNWFQGLSSEVSSAQGFLTGGLTFCSMLPMRSIPFKVIALLGMNEGDFPGIDRKNTFDLTQVQFRKGDRSKRLDNKYQFLETLLSARQKLWLFYQGQLAENNELLQPSSVVSDLIDTFTEHYQVSEEALVTKHPLQSYHQAYFAQDNRYKNYNILQIDIAKHLQDAHSQNSNNGKLFWWQPLQYINTPSPERIEIKDLIQFIKNPQSYFVKNILQLKLNVEDETIEEKEPFEIVGLTRYELKQNLVDELCHSDEQNKDELYGAYKAKGVLLGGEVGKQVFTDYWQIAEEFEQIFKGICLEAGNAEEDLLIDKQIQIDYDISVTLAGVLGQQYQNAMVLFRIGDLDGKSLLSAWIQHLLINQVRAKKTYLIYGKDQVQVLAFSSSQQSISPLREWLKLFISGQQKPSHLFVEPALDYVRQLHKNNVRKAPKAMAVEAFQAQLNSGYHPEWQLLYRNFTKNDIAQLFDEDFEQICERLIDPIWSALSL